jgi:hypothetical protein
VAPAGPVEAAELGNLIFSKIDPTLGLSIE